MLDQNFSTENFRRIFDYENRKGNYLEGLFFPEVETFTNKIKTATSEIRRHYAKKATHSPEDYEKLKKPLLEKKLKLEKKKSYY